jgi:hypothetical protein
MFPFSRDHNYSDASVWAAYKTLHLIDIGPYPNDVSLYHKHMAELKQMFAFNSRTLGFAQSR